jgi:hypothetical protein
VSFAIRVQELLDRAARRAAPAATPASAANRLMPPISQLATLAANARPPTRSGDNPLMTKAQGDACHFAGWVDAEIDAFTARRDRLMRWGYTPQKADDLAERLTLRDREQDDRRNCIECIHLGERGRCLAAAAGRLPDADPRLEPVPTILQRCDAFGLRKGFT